MITIQLGWWLVPSAITVILLVRAHMQAIEDHGGGFMDFSGFYYIFAAIPVLVAWVIYLAQAAWTGFW